MSDLEEVEFRSVVYPALSDVLGFGPGLCVLQADGSVLIELDELTFDQMALLSDAFGTKTINVAHEERQTGGCETCNFEYSVALVTIGDITRWPGIDRAAGEQ